MPPSTKAAKKGAARKKEAKKAPKKKAARKRARRKRPPKSADKSPNASFLSALREDQPGVTADGLASQFGLPAEEVLRYRWFVTEYLRDFNHIQAALRMGYPAASAASTGRLLLYAAYSQLRLAEILETVEQHAIVSGNQIIARLWQESNAPDVMGSSGAGTRIAALKELAKIKQLHLPPRDAHTGSKLGGVMIVPIAATPEEWEAQARSSQAKLCKSVVDV